VHADGDNNVWIQPILPTPQPGFVIWDVINRQGVMIDRIRIPETQTIAGFGPDVVYPASPDAGVVRLEKVRIRG
jgi:hypothetical protein